MPTSRPLLPTFLILIAGAGLTTTSSAQPVLRVYDARDLAAALPRQSSGGVVPANGTLSLVPMLTRAYADGSAEYSLAGRATQPATVSSIDLVVSRVCTQLGLESEQLLDGVYLVKGEQGSQDQFGALLDKTRSLYLGAYEIELACITVPSAGAPAIGGPAETGTATIRTRQTIPRRVETAIAVSESQSYVQDWTPVVSNDAVGYDPQISQVERGLQVVVLLGAGTDAKLENKPDAKAGPEAPVPVMIRGQISDARVEPFKTLQTQPPGTTLEIGLPTTSARTISADTSLPQGRPTVVAVVPGFKSGESIVLALSVRELK